MEGSILFSKKILLVGEIHTRLFLLLSCLFRVCTHGMRSASLQAKEEGGGGEKSPVREDFSRSPPKSQRRRRSFTSEGRFHLSSKEKKQKRFSLSPKSRECCFLFCLFAKNSFSLLQSTPSHSGPLAAVGSIKRQNFGGPSST